MKNVMECMQKNRLLTKLNKMEKIASRVGKHSDRQKVSILYLLHEPNSNFALRSMDGASVQAIDGELLCEQNASIERVPDSIVLYRDD